MISLSALWAVTVRHVYQLRRDPNTLLGILYWPFLDVLMWGFLGSWIQSQVAHLHHYETATLLGLLLWQVIGRGCNVLIISFCEELWTHNIVNIFSLPLRLKEWIGGAILFTALMITLTSTLCMLIIYTLYKVSLWYIFTTFLIFFPPLFISCIWMGFTALQVIVSVGRRGVELGLVIGWFFMPLSGAFYPVEILPNWAQTVSACIPFSYVFKGLREYVVHQQDPTIYLIKGYALGIPYALAAILLFIYCFNRSKEKGLARLAE